jgi:hypothetical protein
MASLDDVKRALVRIAGGKPNEDLHNVRPESYHEVLQGFSPDVIEQVVRRCLKDPSPYFPSSGELYHAACDLVDKQPSGPEAWAYVLEHIQGRDRHLLPERAVKVLRQMGGSESLQQVDNVGIYRAQFLKAYEAERMAER